MALDTFVIEPSWVGQLFGTDAADYKSAAVTQDGITIQRGEGRPNQTLGFDQIDRVEATTGFFWAEILITPSSGKQILLGGIPSEAVKDLRQRILRCKETYRQEKHRREQEEITRREAERQERLRREQEEIARQQAALKRAVALLGEKKNELITLDDLRKQAEQGKFWVLKRDIQAATDIMAGCSDIYAVPLEKVTALGPIRKMLEQLKPLLDSPKKFRQAANQQYLKNEQNQFKDFFETVETNPLTEAQQLAVIANESNVLVVAGAGSGKTSVIVAKAGYLLKKGFCQPDQLLLLAFNRSAAQEMSARIKERIGVEVRATTFHALGLSIIGEVEGQKPTTTRFADDGKLKPLIRQLILDLIRNPATEKLVRAYFQSFFAPYKANTEFATLGEYYDYLDHNNLLTLKGETVKSYEEIEIANFLCLQGIAYEYERKYEYPVADTTHAQYQPDFYLTEYGIYLEHFGVGRDGSTAPHVDQKKYAQGMAWKREIHQKNSTTLIETYSYEKREGTLLKGLEAKLKQHGVKLRPITAEELEAILADSKYLDPFSDLVATFLGHFKGGGHTVAAIRKHAQKKGKMEPRLAAFLDVFKPILERYEERLKQDQDVDFNDMIIRAAEHTESGRYQSPYTYILVDEFQDISTGRARLVKALVKQNSNHRLFCVGDDWQSIYRFAGSDIGLMRNFNKHFGLSERVLLDRTFRFNNRIESVATQFVLRNPSQIKKTIRATRKVQGPRIFIHRPERKQADVVLQILKDLVKEKEAAKNILLLGRYNFLEDGLAWSVMQKICPGIHLRFETVHRAKGQQADYVIILGMQAGKYGFPSEVVDDPLLEVVLSEPEGFEHAEERRLFYVALTRARHAVHLIADYTRPSTFLNEIMKYDGVRVFGKEESELVHCPDCKTGILQLRSGSKGAFYGCTHYPRCSYTTKPCPRCQAGLLVLQDNGKRYVCDNTDCKHTERVCPKCKTGRLTERNGRNGPFLGCSEFRRTGCRYTEDLSHAHAG